MLALESSRRLISQGAFASKRGHNFIMYLFLYDIHRLTFCLERIKLFVKIITISVKGVRIMPGSKEGTSNYPLHCETKAIIDRTLLRWAFEEGIGSLALQAVTA